MTTHTVHATLSGDERAQVQAAVNAGLRELPSVAQRHGDGRLARYRTAWESNDPEPWVGRGAIVPGWLEHRNEGPVREDQGSDG